MLLLLACTFTETGIDSTTLSGSIQVPQAALDEDRDTKANPRDTIADAQELELSWRWEAVSGSLRTFPESADEDNPTDSDYYVFKARADGTFTAVFHYGPDGTGAAPDDHETGLDSAADSGDSAADSGDSAIDSGETGDTGLPPDALLYNLFAYDLSQDVHVHDPEVDTYESSIEVLAGGSTQGAEGVYELSFEVTAGTEYAIGVLPVQNLDGLSQDYRLELSGFSPEDGGVLVGAYVDATDYLAKGPLVAGADVTEWVLLDDGRTWVGTYTMVGFKGVQSDPEAVNDYGETYEAHTVTEGAGTVFLVAGDFNSLNQGLPAGTLHNAVPIQVDLNADQENAADDVVLDTIAPKVIGWTFEEEEPNDLGWTEEGEIDDETWGAGTPLPMANGVGFVDIITGTLEYTQDGGESYENNENDVFALTVPEEMSFEMVTTWPTDHNIDVVLFDSAEAEYAFIGSGYQVADVNPEVMPLSLWGVTLQPDTTYYLVVFPWTGDVGPVDYTIELEWLSP